MFVGRYVIYFYLTALPREKESWQKHLSLTDSDVSSLMSAVGAVLWHQSNGGHRLPMAPSDGTDDGRKAPLPFGIANALPFAELSEFSGRSEGSISN